MLQQTPNSDNEPHTLLSHPPSLAIPICKPSHRDSLSLVSNSLQISQSPTVGFLTQERKQTSSINANLPEEMPPCASAPVDAPVVSHTTNDIPESASNTFAETKSTEEEKLDPNVKSNEQDENREYTRLPPTEDLIDSPFPPGNPSTGLSHEPSFDTSGYDKSNPSCTSFLNENLGPYPIFVEPSPVASNSDIPSSLKFFSFVILHVPEDQEEAGRVCGILNNLEIGEGTTFCEGFETAGASPLKCLEDAVDNSAYIVLLLTTGFLSKWGEFQANSVLMNSIEDGNKSGTVIPFIPKFKTLIGKIPFGVKALIPLNENSKLFEKQVRNTFKQDKIKRQRERWEGEQLKKSLKEQLDDQAGYNRFCAQMLSLMSNMQQHSNPGYGPVIQINNARNVQIGNQNCMNVQQTPNVPQMEMSGECYQECDNEFQS